MVEFQWPFRVSGKEKKSSPSMGLSEAFEGKLKDKMLEDRLEAVQAFLVKIGGTKDKDGNLIPLKESPALMSYKAAATGSMFFMEHGSKNPLTSDNIKAFIEACAMWHEAELLYGPEHPWTKKCQVIALEGWMIVLSKSMHTRHTQPRVIDITEWMARMAQGQQEQRSMTSR